MHCHFHAKETHSRLLRFITKSLAKCLAERYAITARQPVSCCPGKARTFES